MKRRVGTGLKHSEPAAVGGRYDACTEEHLRVSNRNHMKIGLDGARPLQTGRYRIAVFRAGRVSKLYANLGGTAEYNLSSL